MNGGNPTIGDNVVICEESSGVGRLSIGSNSIISAGAVVIDAFSSVSLIGGIPANSIRSI